MVRSEVQKCVPETITKIICETHTKKVPTQVTTCVPEQVTKMVAYKVCKEVPVTTIVKVPVCVTEMCPVTVTKKVAGASAGGECHEVRVYALQPLWRWLLGRRRPLQDGRLRPLCHVEWLQAQAV